MAATYPILQQSNEWAIRVDFSAVPLTSEQFYRLCLDNPELRMELTANRPGRDVECLEDPQSLNGEDVVEGLVLDLHEMF